MLVSGQFTEKSSLHRKPSAPALDVDLVLSSVSSVARVVPTPRQYTKGIWWRHHPPLLHFKGSFELDQFFKKIPQTVELVLFLNNELKLHYYYYYFWDGMLGKWFATVLISQSPNGFLLAFHLGWNCEFVHFSEHLKKTFKLSNEFLVVHWNRVTWSLMWVNEAKMFNYHPTQGSFLLSSSLYFASDGPSAQFLFLGRKVGVQLPCARLFHL